MGPRSVGRYLLYEPFASGGMASVHFGRMVGPAGFSKTVAIKRLHPHLAQDPEFVSMFLDEARLAARIQHPNVVATLDVVASGGEIFLVMDYVLGESWSQLLRSARGDKEGVPLRLVSAVVSGLLNGLHAAHEARTERGEPMNLVHRDVSPQNLLVGADGAPRVVDFGVAKAVSRVQSTQGDKIKGKIGYMAPEQLLRQTVDRRADVYAAGVVLWESLTGKRLFTADDPPAIVAAVIEGKIAPPSRLRPEVPRRLDEVVLRATRANPDERYATALELVEALEAAILPAPAREVAAWVTAVAGTKLDERRALVTAVEQVSSDAALNVSQEEVGKWMAGPATREEAKRMADAATSSWVSPPVATGEPTREQPSSVYGVATGAVLSQPPRPPRSPRAWSFVAGALVAALAGTLLWLRARPAPALGSAPATVASSSPAAASVGADTLVDATASVPAVAFPATVESVRAPSVDGGGGLTTRPLPRRPRPASTGGSGGPRGCDPNFTVDADGVKRFKPWCF